MGDAAHTCNAFWLQGLAISLEDCVNLLNQVDAYSKHFYDAIRQYSQERGCSGDALREITDRCLYYEWVKHINPFVRLRNSCQRVMNAMLLQALNEYYTAASVNHVYSKSLKSMLNDRGCTSYEYAEKQQAKHRAFYHLGRVYHVRGTCCWCCLCGVLTASRMFAPSASMLLTGVHSSIV
ncbi:flavoprotein monooxygenase [Trypanosoma rangeli]|uniref:Flavoprotein monooxygenase n=1 Tax=Trypanosoma rangeli TaxID=5698 RepID=A0A3R7KI09_TRYRA|nr:flavoprotein monooxygenase [Trypanosoma rangeli]RNF08037.1 flavoprotein monooxygenase [Trypanosoma rangeli]|eukprot:RNF08037.1 flavoprotein monooxygenase [Trypanosoma rangeli]